MLGVLLDRYSPLSNCKTFPKHIVESKKHQKSGQSFEIGGNPRQLLLSIHFTHIYGREIIIIILWSRLHNMHTYSMRVHGKTANEREIKEEVETLPGCKSGDK